MAASGMLRPPSLSVSCSGWNRWWRTASASAAAAWKRGQMAGSARWKAMENSAGCSSAKRRKMSATSPAHGETRGAPIRSEQVPARLHELLRSIAVDRPIVVGHSMSGGLACLYASGYPTRGVVVVDNGPDIRPFAQLVRRLEPALRGPGFQQAWATFEDTLGLDRIPQPVRSLVLATHQVNQDVVVGYFQMLPHTDPQELQAWIDTIIAKIDVPCLGVFGRPISHGERERFNRLPDVQLEEWTGDGHFVHLVNPDRFTARLRQFVDHCTATG